MPNGRKGNRGKVAQGGEQLVVRLGLSPRPDLATLLELRELCHPSVDEWPRGVPGGTLEGAGETANILNNATRKSLIILDEIGRGTSTFDGISIAWAIVEYLHGPDPIGAKTLFATHYHELTELERMYPGVKNYNVQVKEWNDEIIFLRKIVSGGADKSYGIHVARLAGLPETVLNRANEVLFNLENSEFDEVGTPKLGLSQNPPSPDPQQLGLFPDPASPLVQKLREIQPDDLTPRSALEKLYELIELLKKD